MEIDIGNLAKARNHTEQLSIKAEELVSAIKDIQVPEDEEGKLDFSSVNGNVAVISNNSKKLYEQLKTLVEAIQKTESQNENILDGVAIKDYKIGDLVSAGAGIQFFESALGDGNSGYIGSSIRPER